MDVTSVRAVLGPWDYVVLVIMLAVSSSIGIYYRFTGKHIHLRNAFYKYYMCMAVHQMINYTAYNTSYHFRRKATNRERVLARRSECLVRVGGLLLDGKLHVGHLHIRSDERNVHVRHAVYCHQRGLFDCDPHSLLGFLAGLLQTGKTFKNHCH